MKPRVWDSPSQDRYLWRTSRPCCAWWESPGCPGWAGSTLVNPWGDRDECRPQHGNPEGHHKHEPCTATNFYGPCQASWRFSFSKLRYEYGSNLYGGGEKKQGLAFFYAFYFIYSNFYLDLIFLGPTFQRHSQLASQCLRSHGWTHNVQITQLSLSSLEGPDLQK